MYDYPPRVFQIHDACFVLILTLPLLLFAAIQIFRPWRKPQPHESILWLVVSVLTHVLMMRLLRNGLNSEIAEDLYLAMRVQWVATGAILIGMLFSISRNLRGGRLLVGSVLSFGVGAFMAAGMLVPLTDHIRNRTRLTACRGNLRQLTLALRSYQDAHSQLPLASAGDPPVSWRVLLLPMLDRQDVYERYDRRFAWDAPENREIASFPVPPYWCFTEEHHYDNNISYTTYSVPTGSHSLFEADRKPSLDSIPDGQSQTVLLLEVCGTRIGWSEPRDIDITTVPIGVNLPGNEPGISQGVLSSSHLGNGAHAAFADGSIRFFSQQTDAAVLKSLLQCDDGKPAQDF